MMISKRIYASGTLSLMALSAVAMGCGEMDGSGEETITSALSGQSWTAFQRSDHELLIEDAPNVSSDSGQVMASGTAPSQVTLPSGAVVIGIQNSTGHWVVDQFTSPNTHSFMTTNGLIRGGTSPSLALCAGCLLWAFGFQGTDAHLWFGQGGSAFNGSQTPAVMASGTSPSVAMYTNGHILDAFQGVNGHLWVAMDGPGGGVDTGIAMTPGTSPSVAVGGPANRTAITMRGTNGHMYLGAGPSNVADTGIALIKAGTSPSAAVSSDGSKIYVAYQSSVNGSLSVLTNDGTQSSVHQVDFSMNNGASPSIMPTPTGGYQIAAKGSNGNLFIILNSTGTGLDQKQDQLFPMN